MIEINSFYEFCPLAGLVEVRESLREAMRETGVRGTIILAEEGYNGMICGDSEPLRKFLVIAESVIKSRITPKSSFHHSAPFRKIDVKIKPEIVTLKRRVDINLGVGTHVSADQWNELISDPQVFVLDTRNAYEYQTGTFARAVNPGTTKFSELPTYVADNMDPNKHKRVAVFCTGGIRCEKFAPYLLEKGFSEVYQLEGGILKYLEQVPKEESLWKGECFVFDERITVDHDLKKGSGRDLSQRHAKGTE
ncbi:MAG: hypothetical protein JO053_12325 [Acidobacteria bacterium]|nr:hypothetical protein [Acidobacteriota bacterium]